MAIARQCATVPARHRVANERLHDVCVRILADPARAWSATGLAALGGLSPASFRRRDRMLFAVAPLEDLVQACLDRARQDLAGGASVATAAQLAGMRTIMARRNAYPSNAAGAGAGRRTAR